jgi:PAP2 superfamily
MFYDRWTTGGSSGMPASFDGNDGNDGNAANSGGAGNASSTAAGWFFADRVNLPLVTTVDTGPNKPNATTPIGKLPTIAIPNFPDRNWSPEWYSWLALIDFVQSNWAGTNPTTQPEWPAWVPFPPPPNWTGLNAGADVQQEIIELVLAAENERADALAEIMSQANEFISYFLNMMTARPGAYPWTTKVLTIASQVGTFMAMYFKGQYRRPRPTQLCPALLPPLVVSGHASFPSGHSTQAHLMALCMNDVLAGLPQQDTMVNDLWTLADRIARNREIAGFHYPSDTKAGIAIARSTLALLNTPLGGGAQTRYQVAVQNAAAEW